MQTGDLAEAVALLIADVDAHEAAGRRGQASTAARLAAGLAMVSGRWDEARALGCRAEDLADHPRARFAALLAQAEVERMAGDPAAVVPHLDAALALAEVEVTGPDGAERPVATPLEHGALLRRRAEALAARGRHDAAAADLARAAEVLAAGGQDASAAQADIERAGVLADLDPAARDAALAAARAHAARADGPALPAVLAQVDAADGLVALRSGDPDRARDLLTRARDGALAAVDPATYIAATAGLAEADEARGDRLGTYRALASGWVTVGDLLGREVGASAFRPLLLAARQRWGAEEFAAVKAAHDAAGLRG